ncbi:FtsX-like permease family protein [Azospirillum sp. TSH100]|uniref:ABC transporter permease n=1 Tax=Azospirillum sp. TSH100 TaxID=652764 RepID=UPI000D6480A9|nr:FtsX-like permease family protein [Azospirillum sp. TSH100]
MLMTSLFLARQNFRRNLLRSLLLVLSIAIAFFIFGVLSSFQQGFEGGEATAERLVVANKISSGESLPLSHFQRIAGVKGVEAVTHITRLRAYFMNQYNIIGANAVEPESYLRVYAATYDFPPAAAKAFLGSRTTALVGRNLAEREGWQIGQRVTVTSFQHANLDGSRNWTFDVAGIFDGRGQAVDTSFMIVRQDYINDSLQSGRDLVTLFGVLPARGQDVNELAHAIDDLFANSGAETRTRTETEFMSAFLEQFADIALIVRLVVGVAFVTILIIVANTMIFAIRERTEEIGVLKVFGFSQKHIVGIVLSETFLLFFMGLLAGLGLTAAAIPILEEGLSSIVPGLYLTPRIIMLAVMQAVAFALLTGLVPALHALRLSAAAALRHR